jgi:radical SAM protein with 4Fe4S-binding SPASM domain
MATTTTESAPGLPRLAEWVFSEGLVTKLNVVRGHEDKDVDRAAKKAGYRELVEACIAGFEEVFAYVESHHEAVDVARQLHVCELSFDNPLSGPPCGIGRNHIVHDHKGFLTDCVMTLHAAKTRATDNLLQDVQATVQHMPFDVSSVEGQSDCLSCQWFTVCGGGRPTGNERVNGHPYTRSPLCEFYKYVIPRYLTCLAENIVARENLAHA